MSDQQPEATNTADSGTTPVEYDPNRNRLVRKVLSGGREPDPRFSLANERTFLAWIRTSLALLAGGIAVEAFTGDLFSPVVRKLLGSSLLILGAAIAASAAWRWVKIERAMRQDRPLPIAYWGPVLALLAAAAGLSVMITLWIQGLA